MESHKIIQVVAYIPMAEARGFTLFFVKVYLEEDCDLDRFMQKWKQSKGAEPVILREFMDPCFVRGLPGFNPTFLQKYCTVKKE